MEQPKNEIVIVAEQSGLEKSKVEVLLQNFNKHFSQAKDIVSRVKGIEVTDVSQIQIIQQAREARLSLKNIRVDVENTRRGLKEQSLREGKAIDGIANIIKALIIPVEEHLEKQEKFIELKEAKVKAEQLADRVLRLSKYVQDISLYNLNDMNDQAFDNLLASSKKAYDDQKEAERKAEEDKIAKEKEDKKENERIKLENEKLKKEREENEKKLAKERELKEKELADERKKAEDERLKQEAKLKKEREENEKLEKKIREEKEANERALAEEEEKKRKALLAPDKTKLIEFSNILEKLEVPNVQSREAGRVIDEAQLMISKITSFLREKAKGF